jgi:hypothetical protein
MGPRIYNSLNKYGWGNHKFEIITECQTHELKYLEVLYKKFILSKVGWKNVLFCELYDKGGGPRNQKTKNKIKMNRYGKNTVIINQYNLQGDFIKQWSSIKLAESIHGKGIKSCLSRKKYTAGGYIWRYEGDIVNDKDLIKIHNKYNQLKKPIIQYDKQNNIIKEWDSAITIEKNMGIFKSNISACCCGKQKTAGGYIWKYKD